MKHYCILPLLAALLLAGACNEDLGNYDYRETTSVTIAGIDDSYQVIMDIGFLDITPSVTLSDGGDPDDPRYDYLWVSEVDTIGRERVLHWQANLPVNTYDLQLRVIDRETGMLWKYKTTFSVVTYHTRGFLLIGENAAGAVQVQMIAMLAGQDTVVHEDLLAYSGLPAMTGPVDVFHTGNSGGTATRRIWVITRSGAYWVDPITLKSSPENTLNTFMVTPRAGDFTLLNMAPRIKQANGDTGMNSQRVFVASDGNLYYNYIAIYGAMYEFPVNCLAADLYTYFPASPYLFYSLNSVNRVIWYDTANERFMLYRASLASSSEILPDAPGDPFPWNQHGRTLVYGENTRDNEGGANDGTSFAITRSTTSDSAFIYKFYAKDTPRKINCYAVTAAGFNTASAYAFSSARPLVFFVSDGKLWCLDYNPGSESLHEVNTGTTDPVTMIRFDREAEPTSDFLYVATYNAATGGTLAKYAINTMGQATLTPVPRAAWGGLVKIVNMSWRGGE
jgi:hypothetical protein